MVISDIAGSSNGISHSKADFLIVGIGASAGGVEALQTFFENVPNDSGIAYVVVLHLSPDYDSQLTEVLRNSTTIPVVKLLERTKVKPDTIYVISPNYHLSMNDGHIEVSQNITIEERRAPVDIFFRTLAETHREKAVCVVLSGTGANGSMGLKRVKENGGAAFVQNPREAHFGEMPRNSIATDLVDAILNVADIPEKIIAYRDSLAKVEIALEPEKRPEDDQQALREIFTQLRIRTGHDFSNYKRATILRRIGRRISVSGMPNVSAYAEYLHNTPDESHALLKDLLISVTNFFRDKAAFEQLEQDIIPRLLAGKNGGDSIRVWIAGCATGEEAYSLAMILAERTFGMVDAPRIQLFASDLDEQAIVSAREGFYTLNDAADVSPDRLRRYFHTEVEGFRVNREIREMILFAQHNLLKDPPFSHVDLITCRNLLIYFNSTAQERVMETAHFALNPNGYLFLGNSESVNGASDLFMQVSKEANIYQSRPITTRISYPVPEAVPSFQYHKEKVRTSEASLEQRESRARERMTYGELHQQLLEQYAPPSVIINEEYDIVHLSGKAGRFLQVVGGEPTQNLLKLIHPELRLELRTALYQAVQQQTNIKVQNLKVTLSEKVENLDIHIRPVLAEGNAARGFILVIFETVADKGEEKEVTYASPEPIARQLEDELIKVKTQLRGSAEQFEVQAEELKASNEEFQAMNEELRSAAEELETSKEELQSINEELVTVNQELKVKIDELSQTNNNFQNLVNSSDIPTIFLDRQFRVNMFTPAAREIFNLIPYDIGRPISDITSRFAYEEIIADAELVLQKLQSVERELTTTQGKTYLLRISPYRTSEDRISGVVVVFIDISARIKAENSLRASDARLRALIQTSSDVMYQMNADWSIMQTLSGQNFIADTGIASQSWLEKYIPAEDKERVRAAIQKAIQNKANFQFEHKIIRVDGSTGWAFSSAIPLLNEEGEISEWFGTATNITEQKEAEGALRQSEEKYRTLFNSIDEGFCILELEYDSKGNPVDWIYHEANPGFVKQTGYKEPVGRRISYFQPDLERVWFENFAQVIRSGEPMRFIQKSEVMDIWFDVYAFCVGDPGDNRICLLFTDVSETKRAEEALQYSETKLRLVIKASGIGTWLWNLDENKYEPDLRVLELFGDPPQGLDHIESVIYFVHPDDESLFKTNISGATDSKGSGILNFEFRIINQKGKLLWLHTVGQTFFEGSKRRRAVMMVGSTSDITERKEAETVLRQSEERYRAIFSQSTAAVAEFDTEGNFVLVNETFGRLVKLTRSELVGMNLRDITHPEDLPHCLKLFDASLSTGQSFTAEKRLLCADDSCVWVTETISPMKDAGNKVEKVLCVSINITERKKTEIFIRDSEERYRIALEAGELATWDWNLKTDKVAWNRQHFLLFGVDREEGSIDSEYFLGFIYPEDLAIVKQQLTEVIGEKGIYSAEFRIRRLDNGKLRWMTGYGRVTEREDGKPTRVSGVMFDSTERREAEDDLEATKNSLNTALEAAKMGVWTRDMTHGFMDRSAKHDELLGHSSWQEDWNHNKAKQFILDEDKVKYDDAHENLSANGILDLEARVRNTDGSICWVHYFGRTFRSEDGKGEVAAGVIYDITDQKTVEKQKDEFIGIASHELKTPVTSIKAYAEILQEMFTDKEDFQSAELMTKLDTQVDRLTNLIRDLLDVTKISEGQLHLTTTVFDMGILIREVAEDVQRTTRQHIIDINISSLPDVAGDRERLSQVLINMLSNAIKYSPGAKEVVVNAKYQDKAICISVRDFGIGMSPGTMEKLFARFFRSDNPTIRSFPGLGLGLFISMEIMKRHGGTISVQSERGKGSIFTMILPVS